MPTECWVDTDRFGNVVDASADGARLFNISARGLRGRALTVFFIDRSVVNTGLAALRDGNSDWSADDVSYRPREQRVRRIRVAMLRAAGGAAVRWCLGGVDAERSHASHAHSGAAEPRQESR